MLAAACVHGHDSSTYRIVWCLSLIAGKEVNAFCYLAALACQLNDIAGGTVAASGKRSRWPVVLLSHNGFLVLSNLIVGEPSPESRNAATNTGDPVHKSSQR